MSTARQLTPSSATRACGCYPVNDPDSDYRGCSCEGGCSCHDAPYRRRRQDRELPEVEPTRHERLRFAVRHERHGWMREYHDGAPTWGGPQEAALFTDEKAACCVAHELGGEIVNVFCKSVEGGA